MRKYILNGYPKGTLTCVVPEEGIKTFHLEAKDVIEGDCLAPWSTEGGGCGFLRPTSDDAVTTVYCQLPSGGRVDEFEVSPVALISKLKTRIETPPESEPARSDPEAKEPVKPEPSALPLPTMAPVQTQRRGRFKKPENEPSQP